MVKLFHMKRYLDRQEAESTMPHTHTEGFDPARNAGTEESLTESVNARRLFEARLARHWDEMKWLYMELYDSEEHFQDYVDHLHSFYRERSHALKARDVIRETWPEWYKQNDMLGMMFYIDNFAGNLKGVEEKIPYLESCRVNYIHLMPFLDSPEGRSDGGYAVADFRKVRPDLGTMEDLTDLTEACHERGINVCMDFVMNHTSEDHEWAKRARAGEKEYQDRYFFYDDFREPALYEQTVPQVFPTTAPGNFTWLPDLQKFVMTSFYPYQWDLNYRNPVVFNEMMYNFLYLVNRGIDVIRIDAVPYIWKELHTTCRNLKQVHTIVRLMRMTTEIVCPGVLLLGEVVMAPEKVVPYFGTVEKPECHMLYNVTTMATTWHTVATRQVKLLKQQLDIVNSLPREYVFLNYLRCHDDIGWGLDYDALRADGMQEVPHKNYLNAYFLGREGASRSRGELYNYDPVTQDARFCGTTASMCGIEKAGYENNTEEMALSIQLDVMLHACLFMQSGIPVIYSGDETAQVNDYSYKEDPLKREDSRYIHRGKMDWERVERRKQKGTVEQKVWDALDTLEKIRAEEKAFVTMADTRTIPTWDESTLCIAREYLGEKIIGVFNFSEAEHTAWINQEDGPYTDLLTGEMREAKAVTLPPYGFVIEKRRGTQND